MTDTLMAEPRSTEFINFGYSNHRNQWGLRTVRRAGAKVIWLGNPQWGYAPGPFLEAFCMDRREVRLFSLERIDGKESPKGSGNYELFTL